MRAVWKRLLDFFFTPSSDHWVSILRIGLGIQVAAYCLSLRRDWIYLFAGSGAALISRALSEAAVSAQSAFIPKLGWLVEVASYFGVNETAVLWTAWLSLLIAGFLLIVGFFSRTGAILAWFLHLCAVKSGGLLAYGMDNFTTIGLFYLMISPLPDRHSFDHVFRKLKLKDPEAHGFCRRLLQLHLCLIYFFGGIAKCAGPGWWSGDSVWRALTHPPFNVMDPALLLRWKFMFVPSGIAICLLETGYAFFIWPRRTRLIWLCCILVMHIGIALAMGMYLFALIMIVLNVAAFGDGGLRSSNDVSASSPSLA